MALQDLVKIITPNLIDMSGTLSIVTYELYLTAISTFYHLLLNVMKCKVPNTLMQSSIVVCAELTTIQQESFCHGKFMGLFFHYGKTVLNFSNFI
jgi:hypothetical protein